MLAENKNFELDSRCPNSAYIPGIEAELAKMNNSLLQQGDCTWAFLGDGREGQNAKRYLFWTSFNTNKVGAGKQIPVLIQTGDGKYYVSETTTGQRTDKKGVGYVAISKSLFVNQYTDQYKKVLDAGTEYLTLEDAYDAYIAALNNAKYDEVRESSRGKGCKKAASSLLRGPLSRKTADPTELPGLRFVCVQICGLDFFQKTFSAQDLHLLHAIPAE